MKTHVKLIIVGLLIFSGNFYSQVSLVKDIYPSSSITNSITSTNINAIYVSNNLIFFTADDGIHGTELWRTDGTNGGTTIIKDIAPGTVSSNPTSLTLINNIVFFNAYSPDYGYELWKTDGTSSGTVLVKDIYTGTNNSDPNYLTIFNGQLYFTASDGNTGTELWTSDGSNDGTLRVKDIYVGISGSNPTNLCISNGLLFFSARSSGTDYELWRTDGSPSGTILVKDINSGTSSSNPANLTDVNGTLFFSATTAAAGTELWKSDGTSVGTVIVLDIYSGTTSSLPDNFISFNNLLFFKARNSATNYELWKSDGTSGNTVAIEINASSGSMPQNFIIMGSNIYFAATDGTTHGIELWLSDGTTASLVKDINSGAPNGNITSTKMFTLNSNLYFSASDDATGYSKLYKSNGSVNNASVVYNINPSYGADPKNFTKLNSTTFVFIADNGTNGYELWKSDGTTTSLVKELNGVNSSVAQYFLRLNNKLVFVAKDTSGYELWQSDGTSVNTTMIKNIYPTNSGIDADKYQPGILNNYIYFYGRNASNGNELWKTDGTYANTTLVKDIYSGTSSSNPTNIKLIGNYIYFSATTSANGNEPWKSDGTTSNTLLMQDIYSGASNSNPSDFTQLGNNVLFKATPDGSNYKLYIYNGSTANIITNSNLNTNPDPILLNNFNNAVYFYAKGVDGHTKLWMTNGTSNNAVSIKNMNNGKELAWSYKSIGPISDYKFITYKNEMYFAADDSITGFELWKTNGNGTAQLVKDLYSGNTDSHPHKFFVYNDYLYFVIKVLDKLQLYKTDGTSVGTTVVSTLINDPSNFCVYNNLLYFISKNNGSYKLSRTDGSDQNTIIVSDTIVEINSDIKPALALANNNLFFSGIGTSGIELYKYVCTLIISSQPTSQLACVESTKSFSVSASTTSSQPLQYQWLIKNGSLWLPLFNDSIYSGVNTNVLTLSNIPINLNQKLYRCVVSGECGFDTTTAATLSVFNNPTVSISCSDADKIVCSGSPVNLTASGASTYSWNQSLPAGAQVTPSPTALTKYIVTGTDVNGCTAKDSVSLNVFSIYNGTSIALVTHDNTNSKNKIIWEKAYNKNIKSYKILRESTSNIGVYDTVGTVPFNDLSVFVDNIADLNYKYKIQVVDSCNTLSTTSAAHKANTLGLTLGSNYNDLSWSAYSIESGSLSISTYNIYRGSSPSSMTQLASTTQLTYRDNNPPSGPLYYQVVAVASNIYFPSYYNGDTRFPYYQVYTNYVFNGLAPQIIQQNPGICPGEEMYLSVAESQGATYQWYKGINQISGAIHYYLSIPSMSISDTGIYYCAVTNSFGSWNTKSVRVSMKSKPVIIVQPTDLYVGKDLVAKFELSTTGDMPLNYQWYKDNAAIVEGIAPILGLTNVAKSDEANYYCKVTNQCGAISSNTVSPTIVPQICLVTVDKYSGYNTIVWERNSSREFDHYNIYREGTVSGYYEKIGTIPYNNYSTFVDNGVNPQSQANLYKITATDQQGKETDINLSALHKTIHLLVTKGVPSGYQLDWDEYIGISYSNYKIYKSINNDIPELVHEQASSTRSWTDPSLTSDSVRYFIAVDNVTGCKPCKANETPTETISQTVSNIMNNKLLFGKEFNILSNPQSQIKCAGDTVAFEVEASGVAVEYQWYKDGKEITTGGKTWRLLLNHVDISNQGSYRCKCYTSKETAYSATATLTINTYPKILSQPDTSWVSTDNKATFSVVASGSEPLSYQWYKNNTKLDGYTNPELILTNVNKSYETKYKCVISNSCGSVETYEPILAIAPQICMVTNSFAIDSNKNFIVWDRNSSLMFDHFNIYRESYIQNKFNKIGQVPYKALTTFTDLLANPRSQAFVYKITVVDTKGSESDIEATMPHKTIHLLVTQGIPSGIQLDWDEYYGFDYSTYTIYRSVNKSKFDSIYSIAATSRTWTDFDAPMTKNLKYYVSVKRNTACYSAENIQKAGAGPFAAAVSNMEDNSRIKFAATNVEIADIKDFEAYPNPFSNYSNLKYTLDQTTDVRVILTDFAGREIKKIVSSTQLPGTYSFQFGDDLQVGIYFLKVTIGKELHTIKIVKIK
jgi:ELWxxDGT repeat protein